MADEIIAIQIYSPNKGHFVPDRVIPALEKIVKDERLLMDVVRNDRS